MIRPRPARWFEILAARDDAALLLEALATTGAVELEARPSVASPALLADVRPLLARFGELALRYRLYWPPNGCKPSPVPEPPAPTLARCLNRIRAWAADAEPLIRQLQDGERERSDLLLWQRIFGEWGAGTLDFTHLATAGPLVVAQVFIFPAESPLAIPDSVLVRRLDIDDITHALAVGPSADLRAIAQQVAALKGSTLAPPAWLRSDVPQNETYIARRLVIIERETARLDAGLAVLHARHDLGSALGDAERLQWIMQHVRGLEVGEHFVRITGWVSEVSGAGIVAAIERAGARALMHFPPPPVGARAPLTLANPKWARPFEIFSRALGMPAANEADPSQLLAFVVPLMFGYMFGDVGQGLVLAVAAWVLRKRSAVARLLVVGGLSAIVFGFLFGSVFSMRGLLPALWLDPLDDPITILVVPLAGGALLLCVGLTFGAVAAYWRGELSDWLRADGGLLGVYGGLLGGLLHPSGFAFSILSGLAYCAGHGWLAGRAQAALSAMGELVEKTLQLIINTLSFTRVGAFALAHAGLSSAVVALMETTDSLLGKALVLIVGNGIVLVLEAMIVSIQTTRLVLFEFFARFLTGEGRAFHPLPPPPFTSQEN